jgi:hypothetical protein
MAGIADQFRGLPIEDLIVSPLVGMAKGQAKLNEVTWQYINEVAFIDGKTRALDVQINKVVTNPDTGEQTWAEHFAKVPMLPLVPLPSLAVQSADIEFNMEVQTSDVATDKSSSSASMSASASGGWFGMKFKASMSGKVSSSKENTRKTDNSAKYNVKVHAQQLEPTEGMLKLSDALVSMMDPTPVQPTEKSPTAPSDGGGK